MQDLAEFEIDEVSGGMRWEGNRESTNVIDCRSGECYDYSGTPMTRNGEYAFDP